MISAKLAGGDELKAKIDAIKARAATPRPALAAGGELLLKAAQQRIADGGPGWSPNISGTPLLDRTGALLSSLSVGGAGDVFDLTDHSVTAGTDVEVNGFNLGALMQGGTGVFGPTGARIEPTQAQALAFIVDGRKVFARSIAGSPQRRFLYIDDALANDVKAVFETYIMTGEIPV